MAVLDMRKKNIKLEWKVWDECGGMGFGKGECENLMGRWYVYVVGIHLNLRLDNRAHYDGLAGYGPKVAATAAFV